MLFDKVIAKIKGCDFLPHNVMSDGDGCCSSLVSSPVNYCECDWFQFSTRDAVTIVNECVSSFLTAHQHKKAI